MEAGCRAREFAGLRHAHRVHAVDGGDIARCVGVAQRHDRDEDAHVGGNAGRALGVGLEDALRRRSEDRLDEQVGPYLVERPGILDELGVGRRQGGASLCSLAHALAVRLRILAVLVSQHDRLFRE